MRETISPPDPAERDFIDKPFAVLETAEYWAVTGYKSLAFRFGPFTGEQIGKIMTRCLEERISLSIVANCGSEFDWELASQFKYPDKCSHCGKPSTFSGPCGVGGCPLGVDQ